MTDFPPAWPWMASLDRENLEHLHADLREIAAEPDLDKAMRELNRLAHEWAFTADVLNDPEAMAVLGGPVEPTDLVDAPRPDAGDA